MRIEPEFPDNIEASLAHALTLARQYKQGMLEAQRELHDLKRRQGTGERVGLTLTGTSAELEEAVAALKEAAAFSGWAMSQLVGPPSKAHRRRWELLSEVLENCRDDVVLLRIDRPEGQR